MLNGGRENSILELYNPINVKTVEGYYEITVKAKDVYGVESEWSDPLAISMPSNKAINTPFLRFLENFFEKFPNAFPILRHLMGL